MYETMKELSIALLQMFSARYCERQPEQGISSPV